MRYSLFLLMFFSFQIVAGQVDWRIYNDQDSLVINENTLAEIDSLYNESGSLIIYSDPRIDSLVNTVDEYPPLIKGYSLEIFFGNRKDAEKVKSEKWKAARGTERLFFILRVDYLFLFLCPQAPVK